jgi:hypothetical protein
LQTSASAALAPAMMSSIEPEGAGVHMSPCTRRHAHAMLGVTLCEELAMASSSRFSVVVVYASLAMRPHISGDMCRTCRSYHVFSLLLGFIGRRRCTSCHSGPPCALTTRRVFWFCFFSAPSRCSLTLTLTHSSSAWPLTFRSFCYQTSMHSLGSIYCLAIGGYM